MEVGILLILILISLILIRTDRLNRGAQRSMAQLQYKSPHVKGADDQTVQQGCIKGRQGSGNITRQHR